MAILALIAACPKLALAQVPVALSPVAEQQFFAANGAPLASGCVFTYNSGTSSPAPTYTDSTGLFTASNPIILDSAGRAAIWLASQAYRFVLVTAGGVNCATGQQQWLIDGIQPPPFLAGNNAWTGNQTFAGTSTFNAALILNGGGTFTGAIAGNPTFTGAPTFTGGPIFTTIAPTFNVSPTFVSGISVNSIAGASAAAGAMAISGQAGAAGSPGQPIQVTAGNGGSAAAGGNVSVTAGAGGAGAAGGQFQGIGGAGGTGSNGGPALIEGGAGTGAGAGATATVQGGASAGGNGGNVQLTAGTGASAAQNGVISFTGDWTTTSLAAPTCSATGIGSAGTCSVLSNASDTAGLISLAASGSGLASSGTINLIFARNLGANRALCQFTLQDNLSSTWNGLAVIHANSVSIPNAGANWSNNGSSLSAGQTYGVNYLCTGN